MLLIWIVGSFAFAEESLLILEEDDARCVWKQRIEEDYILYQHPSPCPEFGVVYSGNTILFLQNNLLQVVGDKTFFLASPEPKNTRYQSILRPYVSILNTIVWPFYNEKTQELVLYKWMQEEQRWQVDIRARNIPKWVIETYSKEAFQFLQQESPKIGFFDTKQTISSIKVLSSVYDFFSKEEKVPTSIVVWAEKFPYIARIRKKRNQFIYLGLSCTSECIVVSAVMCRDGCKSIREYEVGHVHTGSTVVMNGDKAVFFTEDTPQDIKRGGYINTDSMLDSLHKSPENIQYVIDPNLLSRPLRIAARPTSDDLKSTIQNILYGVEYELVQIDGSQEEYLERFVQENIDLGFDFIIPKGADIPLPETILQGVNPHKTVQVQLFFYDKGILEDSSLEDLNCTYFSSSMAPYTSLMQCNGVFEKDMDIGLEQLEIISYSTPDLLLTLEEEENRKTYLELKGKSNLKSKNYKDVFEHHMLISTALDNVFIRQLLIDLEYTPPAEEPVE